jgi:hypothetical protein
VTPRLASGLVLAVALALPAVTAFVGCNAVLGLAPSTLRPEGDADTTDAEPGPDGDRPGDDADHQGSPPGDATPSSGAAEGGTDTSNDGSCGDVCLVVSASCPAGCTSNLACERADGVGACLDPEWAEWPAPASPGKLASDQVVESYTDNGDMTVTDNVTKLMWQQNVTTTYVSQPDAIKQCANLTLAGYHDWRLPTQIELVSLVDYTRVNPSLDASYFPGTPAYAFWSSTPYTASSALGWGVTFDYGTEGYNTVIFLGGVRCVR